MTSSSRHVARALLQALDYLHNLQPNCVVHRDVKPSNVLVDMTCDCPNPLVCVCRNKPVLVSYCVGLVRDDFNSLH